MSDRKGASKKAKANIENQPRLISDVAEGQPDHRSKQRPLLFEYPALPRLEIAAYFVVIIATIIYAWRRIYIGSRSYEWNSGGSVWESYEDVELPLGLGKRRKDTSNYEWRLWTKYAQRVLPWMIGHSVLFNVVGELSISSIARLHSAIMLIYWLIAHIAVTDRLVVGISVLEGVLTYCAARWTRSKAVTWLVGVGILYWTSFTDAFVTYDVDGYGYYITVIIFPYKMVQFLTFTTEMIEARQQQQQSQNNGQSSSWPNSFIADLYNMLWYAFYLPYSSHLIVTYKRFPGQLAARRSGAVRRNWKEILIFGIRIAFWYATAELIAYVFYFEAMMSNPAYLSKVTEDTLVSIGMAIGEFFQLKYVVIFGLPAFFARLDKLQPWEGPICISRVTLYSKIWRQFDRGLYDFFKEYIFLPICRPTFSIGRKIVGVLVSYSFVLIWHGTEHQYVVWIILNIIELVFESVAKIIYSIPSVKEFREAHISNRNFRRILALLQVVTFAFGLYSNFYFLGSSESGYVFVERIFWGETVPVNWPFIVLICLGYCFSHVCMEADRWRSSTARSTEVLEKSKAT